MTTTIPRPTAAVRTTIASSRVMAQPLRTVAAALGAVALAMLLATFFHAGSTAVPDLGDGGAERWIAYPVILWLVLFGGWLTGSVKTADRTRSEAQG